MDNKESSQKISSESETSDEEEISGDYGNENEDENVLLINTNVPHGVYDVISFSRESYSERHGGIFSSIFTLISTMIGGGLLSLPYAFQQGGFIVATCVLLFVLISSTYSAFLIINSKKYCFGRVKNIEDVAKVAFGRFGEVAVQTLLFLVLYLCSVAYFILMTDQIEPLIQLIVGNKSLWTKKLVLLSICAAIVFPISLFKNLSALKYTSMLSVICGLLICVSVTYRSLSEGIGGAFNNVNNPIKLTPKSFREFFTCISISELTFSCHFNILPMHSELRHQTRRNKRLILFISMGLTYLVNFLVSFFAYFQFRKSTEQDFTKNYPHNDNIINVGRVALCLVLLLGYPLLIVPCRLTLNKIIWHGNLSASRFIFIISNERLSGPNKVVWFLETVLIVGTSYILAYFVPQVNMIWGFVGSVGCTTLIYIIPPAFYLRIRKHPEQPDFKKVSAFLLLVFGVILLGIGLYQSFMNVFVPVK
ncbi:sodium-coupled neutral amino acid transporter 5 isoform X1 [Hydra vulgaris]|uniref:sodium-coupled neutral amino acid transporter 5 isoform X1 n=1 Tax=Hydra vulgaris TaxID=6087 RepID=UPI001F5EB1FC|nr:sodium-coupled neutral amino acid transporter 5 [Hydra vulgaris]